jgi:hypothetical protein
MLRFNNSVFNSIFIWYVARMATNCVGRNGLVRSQIGSVRVASDERHFLEELFHWALDSAHHPVQHKESDSKYALLKKREKRQCLKAYRGLETRVRGLLHRFPQDARLRRVLVTVSEGVSELERKRTGGWVSHQSRDRQHGWYAPKGVMPAIGPRLLLAVCIAKELWPTESPYQLVVKGQGGSQLGNIDALDARTRAVEKQVSRVLTNTEKYPVWGGNRTGDPLVLLRQEVSDFKDWRDNCRVDRTRMTHEEFEAQFEDYMQRIRPTSEEKDLVARILDNFSASRKQSKPGNNSQARICTHFLKFTPEVPPWI